MAWKSSRKKAVMMSSLEPPGWQWNAMHYFFIITTAIVQFLFNVNQLVLFLGNKYNILFSKHALSFSLLQENYKISSVTHTQTHTHTHTDTHTSTY